MIALQSFVVPNNVQPNVTFSNLLASQRYVVSLTLYVGEVNGNPSMEKVTTRNGMIFVSLFVIMNASVEQLVNLRHFNV